jgi:hypothetical protein
VVCYERHHGIPGTPLPANSTHVMEVMFSESRRRGSALEEEWVGRRVGGGGGRAEHAGGGGDSLSPRPSTQVMASSTGALVPLLLFHVKPSLLLYSMPSEVQILGSLFCTYA